MSDAPWPYIRELEADLAKITKERDDALAEVARLDEALTAYESN
jgi:hypothetical protein